MQDKEVELKIYLSKLDNVTRFVNSLNIMDIHYNLVGLREDLAVELTQEKLDKYVEESRFFNEVNNNVVNLYQAYLDTKQKEE